MTHTMTIKYVISAVYRRDGDKFHINISIITDDMSEVKYKNKKTNI